MIRKKIIGKKKKIIIIGKEKKKRKKELISQLRKASRIARQLLSYIVFPFTL